MFLNTALGLIILSKDPHATSLRVYDSTGQNEVNRRPVIHAGHDTAQAESARPMCC